MATQIWAIRDGRLRVYKGGYQTYLAQRQEEVMAAKERAQNEEANDEATSSAANDQKLSKNALRRKAERLQEIEDRIHDAETRLAKIGRELQGASERQDVAEIRRISQAYADTESELTDLLEEWEIAHEEVG
jgi:ATPase subunit of ABC transporter with duplicated ATPase domains